MPQSPKRRPLGAVFFLLQRLAGVAIPCLGIDVIWGIIMKRQSIAAAAGVLLWAVPPALALEDQWGFGQFGGTYYAEYTTAGRTVTLYCRDKQNEFIYGMPASHLDSIYPKLDYVDLVLDVDSKDDTYDRIETAVAKVEVTADMIAFKVVGPRAWELQATIGYADVITVGVSQRYLPDNPDVDGKMIYLGNTGASQQATQYVMGPCVPEGYNDQPSSEPEPPADDDNQSVRPN